jgi:uncharacterized protein (TIGR03437 family)
MRKIFPVLLLLGLPLLGLSKRAFSQIPQVASEGVVNSASWGGIVSPGSLVSVFGTNLASSEQWAGASLPLTLGGTSVSVNGIPALLSYVSPSQINLQLPSSLASSLPVGQPEIVGGSLVVTTPAGSSAPAQFAVTAIDPALFTVDSSGCGQAAAQNISPDGTVSVNSHANGAAPGDFIALYSTGLGLATTQPPDGVAASAAVVLDIQPGLLLDGSLTPSPLYAGLAPSIVGMDQIDFQIPADTRNGCSVPLNVLDLLNSPTVTISIQTGRGPCVDPPVTSWGQIQFSRNTFSDTPGVTEMDSVSALFPSGPNVGPPAPPQIVFAPSYVGNVPVLEPKLVGSSVFLSSNAFRDCAVPGYAHLSAGVLQLQTPSAGNFAIQPASLADGVGYTLNLPIGSVTPGIYTIAGTSGNAAVDLQTSVSIGSPIQLQSAFPPGTAISTSQPLTMNWTGGDPGTLVKVSLISGGAESYTYADAAAGTLTISPACSGNPQPAGNGIVCTFGVPPSSTAQIAISVSPSPDKITAVSAPGITGPVQIGWFYSWTFSGLSLTTP